MADTNDESATVTPINASDDVEAPAEVGSWDPATADAASTMAAWRALDQARDEAQDAYESQIEPFKAQFEEKVGPIDEQLESIEAWFLSHASETGADSFDSESGKVTISVRETPKITDADSFFSWAASSNNVGLLQKRISVTQFREFVKQNPDQTLPGVTVEADQSVKFKPAG